MVMRQTQGAAVGIQTLSGSVSSLCVWLGPTTPDREPSVAESVSLFREPARRKPRRISTGRLQSLRLFSTLLATALIDQRLTG